MRKKSIKSLIDQLENTYNDRFVVKNTIAIQSKPVKYLVDFSCEKAVSVGVIVSSNLFGTKVNDINDNYMIRVRSHEIISFIGDMINPFLTCEYKIVFIPGSDVPLGTYNHGTPIKTIAMGLDGFDEFIILARDEITQEIAEKIKQELETQNFEMTVYLLDQVEPALYDCIDEKYFDTNEIEEAGENCFSLSNNGEQYVIEEM